MFFSSSHNKLLGYSILKEIKVALETHNVSALKSDGTLWDLYSTNGFVLENRMATSYTSVSEITRVSGVTIPKRLFMPTDNFGYVFSRNTSPINTMTVYVTTDGWQTYQSNETDIGQNITTYLSPFANGTDSMMFTMQGSYSIFFSKNGGANWDVQNIDELIGLNGYNYPTIGSHFFNRDAYFLVSDNGIIYTSNNKVSNINTQLKELNFRHDNALHVYPNPADNSIQLNLDDIQSVKIYNNLGQLVLNMDNYKNMPIQISHFQ